MMNVIGYSSIGIGLLFMALGVPLILRKVPMNGIYGVRFGASFKSDWLWYEINAHGGRLMVLAGIPLVLYGLYGVIGSPGSWYPSVHTGLTVVVVIWLLAASYLRATRLEKEYDESVKEAGGNPAERRGPGGEGGAA